MTDMEAILPFIPEIITVILVGIGVAVLHGVQKTQLSDARDEIDRLRQWRDDHERTSSDIHRELGGINAKLDTILANGHK